MAVRVLSDGRLEASLAVVITVRSSDAVARCLRALRGTLGSDVPLLAGGSDEGRRALEALSGDLDIYWLAQDGPAAWNRGATLAPTADLVVLDGATEVGPTWLEDLRASADAAADAATVTALSNSASFLSVPRRNLAWPLPPPQLTASTAAARVREAGLGLLPRIPTALPHCAYVRRSALQLVGSFDAELGDREALADFCVRATAVGLAHVVADRVFVAHRGSAEDAIKGWDGAAAERHPAFAAAIVDTVADRHSALSRSLLAASVALEPLEVSIDARSLGPSVTGTTVHIVELLGALVARDDVRVRVLLSPNVDGEAARALAAMPALKRIAPEDLDGPLPRSHVVHRPWQVEQLDDLELLDRLGERTVVTHQDLIGYRTPSVFSSSQRWLDYRATTRDALGLASMVVFFSEEAAADAAADDLVPAERRRVVPLGLDPRYLPLAASAVPPAGVDEGKPFLLLLGTRFRHKNARFALELHSALCRRHGWDGQLVLAGAEVVHGSGSGDEAAWSMLHPQDAEDVIELGAVDQPTKAWLMQHAAAVVYPSTYEGFGLIPFEAAAVDTPAFVAYTSALRETIDEKLAVLVPWDVDASADRVVAVLRDAAERARVVDGLRAAAAGLTWAATGAGVVAAYHDALRLPAPAAARLRSDLARAERDYWSVRDGVPNDLWALVRPDAPLVDEPLARDLREMLERPMGRRRLLRGLSVARRLPRRSR